MASSLSGRKIAYCCQLANPILVDDRASHGQQKDWPNAQAFASSHGVNRLVVNAAHDEVGITRRSDGSLLTPGRDHPLLIKIWSLGCFRIQSLAGHPLSKFSAWNA
ncbi:hypothetical protein [Rhizobium laguerreae]|uniref:hypothetical protein n=1 Tax=Rhizobium laguerreae TaxID=1076926 RepID=UPI001C925874|nr:hypothetical protein [Rhizobium laguerreae]MBY3168666.1 hypothetical protein [Rhizobium laguerreae]